MKILLQISFAVFLVAGAHGQVPAMRRLVSPNADSTDWIPVKEKTGNLTKFSQTTRKLGLSLRCAGMTWSDLSSRGFQYVQNASGTPTVNRVELPGTHESGPHAVAIGKNAMDWTQAEAYNFGRNVAPVVGLLGDQYNEGYSETELRGWIDTRSNVYKWVNEGIRDKAATMTPRPIMIGSYESKFFSNQVFRLNGGTWNPNSTANRNSLSSPANARAGIWWFDLEVSKFIMPIYQVYPMHISGDELLYEQAYGIQRLQKACEGWANPGYTLGAYLFTWPFIAGGGIASFGYPFEKVLTGGKLYQHSANCLSFDSVMSLCLNTFVLTGANGGVYVWEDFMTYSDADPNKVEVDFSSQYKPSDIWKPFNNAPQPTTSPAPFLPYRPLGVFSAPIVAAEFYGEMVAAGGENFQFKRFKVGNSAYIEPGAGETSILEAAAVRRGWCKVSQNGNGYGIYYTNPRGPRNGETITVDLGGGKTVTFDSYGNEPVAIAGNHPGGAATYTRAAAF